jgi:hypothetical protein
MYEQGRMPRFSRFMEGKFYSFGPMPQRVKSFGYNLDALLKTKHNGVIMVDIDGGRGQMLMEVKAAYHEPKREDLVLQDCEPGRVNDKELTIQ